MHSLPSLNRLVPLLAAAASLATARADLPMQTRHATVNIDAKGFISSLKAKTTGKDYTPAGRPSPLLSLHQSGRPNDELIKPTAATIDAAQQSITLTYPNGSIATVKAEAKGDYFRFQLVSLTAREQIDNVVWGPLDTTISGKIGDLIGVVRDPDFAIGMMGIDDNTIAGPVTDGDCYSMGYVVHSPDPQKYPVPPELKEGQWVNIGGNGISDTAFFSRPEKYFQYVCGNGAKVEPAFGSSVAYHSRDRTRSHVHLYSLLPGFERSRPRHMVSDPVPGVDFIGSTVALYACPDDQGLKTLEKLTLGEGLPYITDRDGVWVRDPAARRPVIYWKGTVDKAIEYTKELGLKDISRDTGEYYPGSVFGTFVEGKGYDKSWPGRSVGFTDGRSMHYKEYGPLAWKEGLTHGGLHAMCMFLQGGAAIQSIERLQTVCRTKLAKDISATDTEIVVTDPSFLDEKGTWSGGDDNSNYLRIGTEMLRYEGISETAPWTLKGVKRGHSTKALAHKAGDELAKLHQNVYHGFVPDMPKMLEFADFYASLMHQNNMDIIDFDGFESLISSNHGYYAVRVFCRRFFDTYHKLTGGKWPLITTSNVFPGSWEYLNYCNVGAGTHMLDPVTGKRPIQGRDLGDGWSNSWFPPTFGKQGWSPKWSMYDVENLQAKAIGWDATYALVVTQEVLDGIPDRVEVFKAFRAWQDARTAKVFTEAQKEKLRDPAYKFHLEQTGEKTFTLYPVTETRSGWVTMENAAKVAVTNASEEQSLWFDLMIDSVSNSAVIALPDGGQIKCTDKLERQHRIICRGDRAWLTDKAGKKIADLEMSQPAKLAPGESQLGVHLEMEKPGKIRIALTTYTLGKGEPLGN